MILDIDKVIYSYLFICAVVLLYNILHIFFSDRRESKNERSVRKWISVIEKQIALICHGKPVNVEYNKLMKKKLINTNQLICYANALDILRRKGEKLDGYLKENFMLITSLAYDYAKKESMDRAFFAFFISINIPCDGKEYNTLMEILISYLEDSTVYCRENVLKAIYALGNLRAIENALQVINDHQWFHHHKLLSDGLMTFTGNKEELAELLWTHLGNWGNNLMVSVVQFITASSDKFKEGFMRVLQSGNINIEIRLAILRYYRRHIYEPVRPLLISYLKGENAIEENIGIVTASVLDSYPGEDTIVALKAALNHSNWYFRYNAAFSLISLKVDINQLQDVLQGKDSYAKEILIYMMQR